MKQFAIILFFLITYNLSYSQIVGTNEYTKTLTVNISTPLEITDLDGNSLNKENLYRIQLVTTSTGTRTGASYIAWSFNGAWQIRAVGISGNTSNHPQLIIDSDVLKVTTNHTGFYTIRTFVKEIVSAETDVTPYVFGGDYQWQRYQNTLYYLDGNVGIGTDTPSHKLQVELSNNTEFKTYNLGSEISVNTTGGWSRAFRIRNENDNVTAAFGAHNGDAFIATGFDGISNPSGGSNKKLIVKTSGNVGIGTDTPSQKLVVSGSAIINNPNTDFTFLQLGNETNDRIIVDNATNDYYGGGYFFRVNDEDSPNGLYRDVMMLSKTGQVGIGTRTMGNHNLAVEGSIGAREIKVEASGWSDFVFENDYNLPTLKEVEEHINQKGHLKDIPSAADVDRDGINLGEMNSKLLQKIEELTLYTIAQEKRLLEMEEKMKQLEKE